MIDGSDQAAAFQAALDRGLPALIGGACKGVEDGIQNASPATFALRCSLLAYLRVALWTAELVLEAEKKGGPAPASVSPGQSLAPVLGRDLALVEPLVPRRSGGPDPRLPAGRYHP